MSEGNRLNLKVGVPGKTKSKTRLQKHLTLELITSWIKIQGFDEYTTNGLIELASGYPTQALPSFRRNFNLMIERVREKRTKEQQGQEQEVQEIKVLKKNKYEDLPDKVAMETCQVAANIVFDTTIPDQIILTADIPKEIFVELPQNIPEQKEQENGEETTAS